MSTELAVAIVAMVQTVLLAAIAAYTARTAAAARQTNGTLEQVSEEVRARVAAVEELHSAGSKLAATDRSQWRRGLPSDPDG